ncbi:MAG: hypothetical protein ACT4N4_06320 [Rhodospirillales bacterium]
MTKKTKRHMAYLLAAEVSMSVIGGARLAWLGADIVGRALRITLIGESV